MNYIDQLLKSKNDKMSVCGYNSEFIVISSKSHKDFDSLMAAKDKKGMLETVDYISIESIVQATLEESSIFILYLNSNNKQRSFSLSLEQDKLEGVFNDLQEMKKFKMIVLPENNTQVLLLNLFIYTVITGIIVGIAYFVAEREHGIMTDSPSRKKVFFELLMKLGGMIGSRNLYILAALLFIYFCYSLYKRFNNPHSHKTIVSELSPVYLENKFRM